MRERLDQYTKRAYEAYARFVRWRWRESNPRPESSALDVYKLSHRFHSRPGSPGGKVPSGQSRFSSTVLSASGCCPLQSLTALPGAAGHLPRYRDRLQAVVFLPYLRSQRSRLSREAGESESVSFGTYLVAPVLRGRGTSACSPQPQRSPSKPVIPMHYQLYKFVRPCQGTVAVILSKRYTVPRSEMCYLNPEKL